MVTALVEFSGPLCDLPTPSLAASNPSSKSSKGQLCKFRFILVTSRIKLLQRLHITPGIISRPHLSVYSSFGPAEFSKLISYTPHLPCSNQIQQLLILQPCVCLCLSSGCSLFQVCTFPHLVHMTNSYVFFKTQLRCPSSCLKAFQDLISD